MKHFKNVDGLIQGIRIIISENRYSLSGDDIDLLEECIDELSKIRKQPEALNKDSLGVLLKIFEKLLYFFANEDMFNRFKDLM